LGDKKNESKMRDLQSQVDDLTKKIGVANINLECVEKRNRELIRSEKTLQQRLQRHDQLLLKREAELLDYKMQIKLLEDAEKTYKEEIKKLRAERFEFMLDE
jgi:hypothetical protein